MPVPKPKFVFTGLYKNWGWSLSDVAKFNDGKLVYSNWASGEPQSNQMFCGSIGGTGKWFVTDCGVSQTFICYNGESAVHVIIVVL